MAAIVFALHVSTFLFAQQHLISLCHTEAFLRAWHSFLLVNSIWETLLTKTLDYIKFTFWQMRHFTCY